MQLQFLIITIEYQSIYFEQVAELLIFLYAKVHFKDAKLRHFADKFSFLLPELEEEEEEEPGAWGLTEEPTIRQFPFRHHLTIIIL